MDTRFENRTTAGEKLAERLRHYRNRDDVIVLALPRGGVPVAAEVARALGADLDLILVRKLGTPGQPELAMGAIASGGARILNQDVVRGLQISELAIQRVEDREQRELERRERAFRGDRPRPDLANRSVILVDDGLATGATMKAAIGAVRRQSAAHLVVAVPVAPPDTVAELRRLADEVVCLSEPEPFVAIGMWYRDFSQLEDADVVRILERCWRPEVSGRGVSHD